MRFSKYQSRSKPFLILAASALAMLAAIPISAAEPSSDVWHTNVTQAEKAAKKTNRPLLIHFYADWCRPCRKMERETFGTAEFQRQIRGRFIAVKIDIDKQPEIAKRFAVNSLPTDLVITPAGGVLARSLGYQKKPAYLASLARWDAKFVDTTRIKIAAKSSDPNKSNPRTEVSAGNAAKKQRLLGMDGYSPVALHANRTWIMGRREFAATYQGITYWMASAEELAEFRRDPRRFAPRLLGCDPVILQETDRAVPGQIDYGAFFDGELFFFASDANRKRFRAKPLAFTRTRHVLLIKQVGGRVRR